MAEIYKIDIDGNIKVYNKWIKHFEKMYRYLRYEGIKIDDAKIYKTRHGYHIYLYGSGLNQLMDFTTYREKLNYINLIESLLGSDLFKQVFSLIEQSDILFKTKNGYTEWYMGQKTADMNKLIASINRIDRKLIILTYQI